MKAIQFLEANHIGVCDVDMPEVPEGWALIKVSHAGICGTDLNIYSGTHPRAKAPLTMGHEFSGVVAQDCERFPAPGDNAIVFGCGTIGLCLALTLKQFGVGDLLLVETDAARLALARELGFEAVNPMEVNLDEVVAAHTNGNGFDRVYDCAGAGPVAASLLDVVKVRGQIVIVASYKKPPQMPFFKGMAKEVSIHFVRVYRQKDFAIEAQMAEKEPLFEKIITHVLPYEEAQKGFDLLFTPGTGAVKVMFEF